LSDLSFINNFKSIWLEPRATIKHIVETNSTKHVITIAILGGIAQTIGGAQGEYIPGEDTLMITVIAAIISGIIGGILGLYIGAYLIQWTGKWIGGTASREHIRCASAWAMLPLIPVLAIWCFWLAYFGEDIFIPDSEALTTAPGAFIYLLTAIPFATCCIWTFFTTLKTLAQVQGFSAWKALANILLTILVLAAIAFIVVLLIAMIFS